MHSRTIALVGEENFNKLQNAKVLVVGLGGVGGYVVEGLVRAGIGTIGICDFDKIDVSNKNRQIIATDKTVGMLKTDAFEARIKDINPDCKIVKLQMRLSSDSIDSLNIGSWDYIADAIDDVPAKIELICAAKNADVNIISSMGTGNKLDPAKFKIDDIEKTSVCPLARKMRKELKDRGIRKVPVLYSTEEAVVKSYDVIPSISFVPSVAGLEISGKIIKDLLAFAAE